MTPDPLRVALEKQIAEWYDIFNSNRHRYASYQASHLTAQPPRLLTRRQNTVRRW